MRKAMLIVGLVMLLTACNAPFAAQPGTQTPIPSLPPQPTLTLAPTLAPVSPPATTWK